MDGAKQREAARPGAYDAKVVNGGRVELGRGRAGGAVCGHLNKNLATEGTLARSNEMAGLL